MGAVSKQADRVILDAKEKNSVSSIPASDNEDEMMIKDPEFIADMEASESEITNGETRKWKDFKWKV